MNFHINDRMNSIKPSPIREMFKLAVQPGVISLSAGSPCPEAYPVEELREISAKLFADPVKFLNYGVSEGYGPLKEFTLARLRDKYHTGTDKDALLITAGGQQSIDLACKCILNPGDGVICESPSFTGSLNTLRAHGARLLPSKIDDIGLVPEAVEEILKKENVKLIYTIPTFQNPSGRTLTNDRRKQLLELAEKYDCIIIEDDPYSELYYTPQPVTTIKSMDTEGRVIYCGSYSKVVAPGLRVGYALANETLLKKMTIGKQSCDVHTGVLNQMLVSEFVNNYDLDAHLTRVRNLYREKRDVMMEELAKGDPRLHFTIPDGGLFAWCSLPDGYDSRVLSDMIWEKGKVLVVPGCACEVDMDKINPAWRMNFSMPSKEDIRKGISILNECAKELMK